MRLNKRKLNLWKQVTVFRIGYPDWVMVGIKKRAARLGVR